MAEMQQDLIVEGHEYDGIQEYDNPTPGWWHLIFFGSIVFGVLYMAMYHFSPMVPTLAQRHDAAESKALAIMFAEINDMPLDETKVRKIMFKDEWLSMGQSVYAAQCVTCHAADGQGLVGPNMTDDHYKNVTDLAGVIDVINNGAGNGAMPAWQNRLDGNEVALVAAYMASLRGQFLEGRPPEGDVIPPWPEPIDPAEDAGG